MNEQISIKALSEADRLAWENLYADYASVWNEPITEDRLARVWEFLQNPKYEAYGLGLYDGTALVGFGQYMLYPCTYSTLMTCYLQDLYVAPSHRGKGLGKEIIQHIAEIGKAGNWRIIHWKTHSSNIAAQKMYNSIAERDEYLHYTLSLH